MKKKLLAASLAVTMLSGILMGCSRDNLASYDENWDNWDDGGNKTSSKNTGSDTELSDLLDINNGEVVSCVSYAKNVNVPNGVTSIANGVFANHAELVAVSLPDSLTQIGSGAFSGCGSLFSVYIPDGVTKIPDNAFEGCSSLAAVYIPGSVTEIGKNAFKGCEKLTTVTMSENVVSVDSAAFEGCSALTYLEVPSTVKSLADDAFKGCVSLTANYRTISFAPRDLITLCDVVNGNYKRADMSYKQAQEILGVRYPVGGLISSGAPRTDTFDDINSVDILWLIEFIDTKTNKLIREEYNDPAMRGEYAEKIKFTDIEKYAKEYINPDFDINAWKKNVKTWNGDDEYLIITHGAGGGGGWVDLDIEDCYSMGHKTFITAAEVWRLQGGYNDKLSNSLNEDGTVHTSDNTRWRYTYRNEDGKYYLESAEKVTVDDLEPWNQTMVKVFDELHKRKKENSYYAPSGFYFADVNNDSTIDLVVECSYYSVWVFDGKDGSFYDCDDHRIYNYNEPIKFKKDTVTGRYAYFYTKSNRGPLDSFYYEWGSGELASCYIRMEFNGDISSEAYVGGKSVSVEEYNEYVKRFEDIPSTSFDKITLAEFIEAFRTALS